MTGCLVLENIIIIGLLPFSFILKEEVSVLSMEAQSDLSLNANVSKVNNYFFNNA